MIAEVGVELWMRKLRELNVMEWDADARDMTIGSSESKDIRKWNKDERTYSGSSMP